jgi:hypothetical protein
MVPKTERKKVLIITYYWPPCGGIGVLRNLKFVKYLRDFGWEPIIYTAKNPKYPFIDKSNQTEIPEEILILKGKIWEPLTLFKKLSGRKKTDTLQNITATTSSKKSWIDNLAIWIRGNFFIPDARAAWIKPSVTYLSKFIKEHKIDALLTDGPPHTNTVIGMRLSQKFGIPWLADFQDPWTQVDYFSLMKIGSRADKKHRKLEQEAFRTAKKTTIASPSWKIELENIGATNVDVIYYGFDEADFRTFQLEDSPYFSIFHAGLLGNDRNINTFFETIKEMIEDNPLLKNSIRINFAGEVDYSNKVAVKKNNLESITTFYGMISRPEVIQHYQKSSLLLLPINQASNAKGRIPGKLFEYLRTFVPILAFGPEKSDVKDIIEQKGHGISLPYNNSKKEIKAYLLELIQKKQKSQKHILNADVSEFSNFNLSCKLANYLDEIITKNK